MYASDSDSEQGEDDPSADLVSRKKKPEQLVAKPKIGRTQRRANKAKLNAAPGAQGNALISSLSLIEELARSALELSKVLLPKKKLRSRTANRKDTKPLDHIMQRGVHVVLQFHVVYTSFPE